MDCIHTLEIRKAAGKNDSARPRSSFVIFKAMMSAKFHLTHFLWVVVCVFVFRVISNYSPKLEKCVLTFLGQSWVAPCA